MTRINCIPVEDLVGQHLIAEYRELPRVFGLVRKAILRGEKPNLNSVYTLGTGHVKFFYSRLMYLRNRHKELVKEMQNRGYSPNFTDDLKEFNSDIPNEWWNDWTPSVFAMHINLDRINERLKEMNK